MFRQDLLFPFLNIVALVLILYHPSYIQRLAHKVWEPLFYAVSSQALVSRVFQSNKCNQFQLLELTA